MSESGARGGVHSYAFAIGPTVAEGVGHGPGVVRALLCLESSALHEPGEIAHDFSARQRVDSRVIPHPLLPEPFVGTFVPLRHQWSNRCP